MSDGTERDPTGLLSPPWRITLVWLVAPGAVAAITFGLLPLRSWDCWWHLSVGRHIARTGDIPTTNMWLYTLPADAPSFVQPWLSQTLLYEIEQLGGLSALLTARNLITAGTFGALTWVASRRAGSPRAGSLLTFAGLAFAFPYIAVRTHLFVWPMYVGLLVVGLAIRSDRLSPAWMAAFPLATALWVQLHGSFPLVLLACAVFGTAAAFDWLVRGDNWLETAGWAAAAGTSALATGLHPRGFEVWRYVAELSGNSTVRTLVTEWSPASPSNPPVLGALFYAVVAASIGLIGYRIRDGSDFRPDWSALLLLAATAVMAALRARGLLWFGLTLPVAVAPCIPARWGRSERSETISPAASVVHGLLAAALVGAGLLVLPVHPLQADLAASYRAIPTRTVAPGRGRLRAQTPVEAVDRLQNLRPTPRLFHDQRYAGYLLWRLDPGRDRRIVFVDQRIELPPPRIWSTYMTIGRGKGWRTTFRDSNVDAVLASDRQAGLRRAMRTADDATWQVRYEDRWNTLFVRAQNTP